ncbi:MAG TPA: hypothetical protein VKU00_04180 [Chthonomonadaceae bacterium]|nr:hypothetical protein [Chthonomonadaceae bacterium]
MAPWVRTLLLWSPRVVAILVVLFLSLFALDVFEEKRSLAEWLLALFIHLIPSLLLLAAVILAWRREWIGGVVFVSLAALYCLTTLRRLDWVLFISGPLLTAGLLYLLSWSFHRELHPPR